MSFQVLRLYRQLHIAEAQHDWKGALSAWQKVLDLDPKTPDGRDRLQDLRRRALGDSA